MVGFMLKQCPFSCNVCDVKEHGNKYCADRDHEQVYRPCDARATAGASALLHTTAMAPLTPPLTSRQKRYPLDQSDCRLPAPSATAFHNKPQSNVYVLLRLARRPRQS